MNIISSYDCVIVANGSFPTLPAALDILSGASVIIACDGAVRQLHRRGIVPTAVVGDLDSVPSALRRIYADRMYAEAEQDTNDLTKAVNFACREGVKEALILGATGLREDHTIANVSLLADYSQMMSRVEMMSDYGLFTPLAQKSTMATLRSFKGQQVSIFSLNPEIKIVYSEGLRWPLRNRRLTSWWQGSLNEATGETFSILFSAVGSSSKGGLIVYRCF